MATVDPTWFGNQKLLSKGKIVGQFQTGSLLMAFDCSSFKPQTTNRIPTAPPFGMTLRLVLSFCWCFIPTHFLLCYHRTGLSNHLLLPTICVWILILACLVDMESTPYSRCLHGHYVPKGSHFLFDLDVYLLCARMAFPGASLYLNPTGPHPNLTQLKLWLWVRGELSGF